MSASQDETHRYYRFYRHANLLKAGENAPSRNACEDGRHRADKDDASGVDGNPQHAPVTAVEIQITR